MRSIRTRITALTLAAILLSILAFGSIGVYAIHTESEKSSALTLNLVCENRKDSINEYLNSIQQSVGMISRYAVDSLDSVELTEGGVLGAAGDSLTELPGRSEEQRQALDAYFDGHLAVIEVAFQSIANHTNGVASCYYRINPEITTGEKGFLFSKKGNYDFQKIPMTDLAAYDRSDTEHVGWYYIPLEQGRPSWMEPYYSEVLDELVISYVVPIYKSGTFIGVIGMDIQFDTLVELIQQSTSFETGFFSLTDNEGVIFYHPDYEMGTELEAMLPQLLSTAKAMHQDSSLQQLIRYDKDGTKWQLAFTTLANGMKLSAVVQEAEINAAAYRLTNIFFVAGGLILLVFAALCAITMRHVTDPLNRLTIAARQLAAGNYDVEVSCNSSDEVGVLTDTFCTMRDRLKDQFIQLSESKQNLQEALMDAQQASRAKTSFLSNMSHEIRTPMNAIIWLDNIALRDPDLSPCPRQGDLPGGADRQLPEPPEPALHHPGHRHRHEPGVYPQAL